ncbi:MAG: glycosyltransferase [Actinophytocola sp.]|nr:glycosyltransferase [Actinophytocola sp.]
MDLLPRSGGRGETGVTITTEADSERPGARHPRRGLAPYPDEVDARAVEEFHARYQHPRLSELVVVIAAFNEQDGLGPVLADMPKKCNGMDVDVLVVVDGATDDTAEIAREQGAYTCVADTNRGQGAALRLGYHLAAECGATYLVTTDADGQYDNTEMDSLLSPLVDDEADFVTGSRRLGHEESDNRMRWIGVRVFAWLASLLTLRKITDTSFGFRAMRAELACTITLTEPQYQASELLLGALATGARLRELPMSMRLRNNGTSKKGKNLRYGANYTRVMLTTWLREYPYRNVRK